MKFCSLRRVMDSIALTKPKEQQRRLLTLLSFFTSLLSLSFGGDILTLTEPLPDGQTLVSARGTFELGFFSPGCSTHRYLGIWYKQIPVQTVVWVANRNGPLPDQSGLLRLGPDGDLHLTNGSGGTVWSTGPVRLARPVAQLLDSGNIVLREVADTLLVGVAWQSFDYPTDTSLPGMRFSSRFRLGLTPWRNANDPALGDYTLRLEDRGMPQLIVHGRSGPVYRPGQWNGLWITGTPEMKSFRSIFSYLFVSHENESYVEYQPNEPGMITRMVLDPTGSLKRFIWVNSTQSWNLYWSAPKQLCDVYGSCGPYGVCNSDKNPVCKCLKGFAPRSDSDRTAGCVRGTALRCEDRDGFRTVVGMKLPDTRTALVDGKMGLEECREACAGNCSCVAYARADISGGGSGCILWVDDLMDLQEFYGSGQELYIRMAASEIDENDEEVQSNTSLDKNKLFMIIPISVSIAVFFLGAYLCYSWKKKVQDKGKLEQTEGLSLLNLSANVGSHSILIHDNMLTGHGKPSGDVTLFSFATIAAATGEFSHTNRLGEGGFGIVYKGTLPNGHEVAVKRLSNGSGQGLEEFKNEVMLTGRLQHSNLVRLLGVCLEREEKILIYEYLSNNSLDSILFDTTKAANLDWGIRMRIIDGIAQGLLYLHKYSRVRIIHRDLKASNVLLDADLTPKISDFGMAKLYGGNEQKEDTNKIVGTLGYMSPEYAKQGLFSEKSDVFSFGVLLLEIVSGKKNSGFQRVNDSWNLLQYAWKLWEDGRALELVDPVLGNTYLEAEVLKCIHVGLLCVQRKVEDRPTMSTVVSLLGGNAIFPAISRPAFSAKEDHVNPDLGSHGSVNGVTITLIETR